MQMLLSITGPSGSGKSTVLKELVRSYGVGRIITCTTRAPRPREKAGEDYFFLSVEEFCRRQMLAPTHFAGTFYGIDLRYLRAEFESGKEVMAVILDPAGARAIKECKEPLMEGITVKTLFIDVAPKVALARMGRRDGWRKAKERQKADIKAGMFLKPFELAQNYDCVLKNDKNGAFRTAYDAACFLKAVEIQSQLVA